MADTNEKVLSLTEKKISSKGGNEETIQRIIIKERDGSTYKMISDINKKKIKKAMLPQVIERMGWSKFGIVAGQPRGSLEPGIIATSSEEIHIIDRKKDVEQDLADKFRDTINNRKMMVLKEMKEIRERENREKLAALTQNTKNTRQMVKRNREGTIKVTGFNPIYDAKKLAQIFEVVGPVKKCNMPSKNLAFLQFEQTVHANDAFERFNDESIDGCVLRVIVLDGK